MGFSFMDGSNTCDLLPSLKPGNDDIQIFIEGDELFDAMIRAINNAQHQVLMETYIFADDEVGQLFVKALSEKAKSGVQVYLLVDALGSLFQFYRSIAAELNSAGVHVQHFQPWNWRKPLHYNRRDHRKLLVIDEEQAFLGGFNIHRQSSLRYFGIKRWRDTHVSFNGQLAKKATAMFNAFWDGERYQDFNTTATTTELITNHNRRCRHHLACIYNDLIESAEQTIYLTTPYFIPNHRIQNALILAAERGVDVSLLVPFNSDVRLARWASNAVYARLLDSGIKIFEYFPRMLHAKIIVVDQQYAMLGTANLDYRSLLQNYELNLISRDLEFCRQLHLQFKHDLDESKLVSNQHWKKRRWFSRLTEYLGWSIRHWL
ncbi:MAG: phospholipase D-like domain-containing protein [Gammaproteobacteria bacterium]|nr:phospholipase D-like domain-containing protein [Gammaproteobacteria bacterium]